METHIDLDGRGSTCWADVCVDVPLLMSHPKSALLPVLQLLQGWQSVGQQWLVWVVAFVWVLQPHSAQVLANPHQQCTDAASCRSWGAALPTSKVPSEGCTDCCVDCIQTPSHHPVCCAVPCHAVVPTVRR